MKTLSHCPVCGNENTRVIGSKTSRRIRNPTDLRDGGANTILEVVLGVDEVRQETKWCDCCSHMFVDPTFDEAELRRMYSGETRTAMKAANRQVEQASGTSWAEFHGMTGSQQSRRRELSLDRRPKDLRRFLDKTLSGMSSVTKVLDVGGGDGSLLKRAFPHSQICVFDLNPQKTDSDVLYLTSTEEAVAAAPYEFVGSFHTFEHIPTPVSALESFLPFMREGTLLCIEVPLEYVGPFMKGAGLPLGGHINCFTRNSLNHLANSCGFATIRCQSANAWYGETRLPVIRGLYRFGGGEKKVHLCRNRRRSPSWVWEFAGDLCTKVAGKISNRFY